MYLILRHLYGLVNGIITAVVRRLLRVGRGELAAACAVLPKGA